MTMSKFRIIYQ